MAEPAPFAGEAYATTAVPPPLPTDDAGEFAEIPPPVDLEPQQLKTPAPRPGTQALLLIPLCRKGDRVGIERVIQEGASVAEMDIEGNTPLHVAVEAPKNEIATVQCLLEQGANINALNCLGAAPLHYVCLRRSNHRGIANILLENGAAIDCQTTAGKSPLHFACEQQNAELVEVLLVFGANPSLLDVEGNTPMHLALAKPNGRDTVKRQISEHLMSYNAVFTAFNAEGYLPLHLACRGGYIRSLSLLLERQADPNALTARGETALHLACGSDQSEVTQLLLQVSPQSLNAPDLEGNTPLHVCAGIGNLDSAILLLRMGVDTNVRNSQKKSAFDISKTKGTDLASTHNPELQHMLKDAQKSSGCRQS